MQNRRLDSHLRTSVLGVELPDSLQGVRVATAVPPTTPRKSLNDPLARQDRALRQRRAQKGESHIQVRRFDFGSHGVSSVLPPTVCGSRLAQQDVLSELETTAVLHVRSWGARKVLTQYALRLEDDDPDVPGARGTQSVASDLGFVHPSWQEHPLIMTTDVVAWTTDGGLVPFFVRYDRDLPKPGTRQMQLLEIAAHYWRDRNASLSTYTELRCSRAQRDQLIWAADGAAAITEEVPEFLRFLRGCPKRGSLAEILSAWPSGRTDGLLRYKHAVAIGRVALPHALQLPTIHTRIAFKLRTDAQRDRLLRANAGIGDSV